MQLIFQQILIGRPPDILPATVSVAVAFPTGLALIFAGIQLWVGAPTRWLFVTLSVFVFAFSGLSNFFMVISHADPGGVLTSFGKSITLGSAIILFLQTSTYGRVLLAFHLTRVCLGVFLAIGGVQHFLFADFVKFLVPRWIPFDAFWTYAAGVALIASGVCLMLRLKIRVVGFAAGLMVFAWLLVLHIPRGIADPSSGELTAVCEALAVSTILFALSKAEGKSMPSHPAETKG